MGENVVIVGAKRTPIGAFQGVFKDKKSPALGSVAIRASLKSCGLDPATVDEVYMGCVLSAGVGQAPARQASLGAGISHSVPCSTINKVCGSGMKAVMLGHDQIMLGHAHAVIAGGMENMTLAPYLLDKARAGYRIGHHTVIDHMFFDGLEDAYHNNRLMGTFAEDTAEAYGFTREDQDNFARTSLERALHASHSHFFQSEIAPVEITSPKSSETIAIDETPTKVTPDKIAKLKPAFRTDGTVTAANSSSISDGAAALVLMSRSKAKELNIPPLAVIKGHATHAHQPEWFTTAPAFAIEKLCHKIGWSLNDVDLFEINEAFAVVTMAAMKDLNLPHEKVNIWGGACALGHPIGSSGARIIVTLIHSLIHTGGKRGIASLCIGGGEATAIAVELMG